jgi:SAM-dependent methyltransferase
MSQERNFPDWENLYQQGEVERLPWYHPELDPDLEQALARRGVTSGTALDLGTGPATQALALAERGFEVTGTDLSEAAVARASALAQERGLSIRFVQDDILNSRLTDVFKVVFDRGCFHVMPPDRRGDHVRAVRRLVAPDGFFFLKCFSTLQPGDQGPHRFSPEMIRELFGECFEVLSVDETVYQGTLDPLPRALFATMRPLPGDAG